jgi:two-component system, sensor histidine kinase and response regulator
VVEDVLANQKVAQSLLRRLGLHVDIADNGRVALEMLESNSYDLLFMDAHMPEMDGYETTQAIRKNEQGSGQRVPIIALTANNLASDRNKCLASGMDDFLSKPFNRTRLISILKKWLNVPTTPPVSLSTHLTDFTDKDSIIDMRQIDSMREAMGEDFSELIPAFQNSVDALLDEMASAVLENDSKTTQRTFHSLKSAASNLGATRLHRIASTGETYCRSASDADLQTLIDKLAKEYEIAKAELSRIGHN